MAFKHGFFNAVYDSTAGDYYPRYDAGEFARRFSLYFTNGVFYNASNALQITAGNGLQIRAGAGAVNINGYDGVNEQAENIQLESADAFYPRYDIITARLDISNKWIGFNVIKGEAVQSPSIPNVDNLVRSSLQYDLMLAYIYIPAGATAITNANITDTRGDSTVCGFVTGTVNQLDTTNFWTQWQSAFNQYASEQEAEFNAWWSGLKDELATINATALMLRQDALEERVNEIHKYDYVCNSVNDNVLLSEKVQELLEQNGFGSVVVNVYGAFGATDPIEGNGTATSWYKWLMLGISGTPTNKVTVDFSNCTALNIPIKSGKYNTIISGGNVHIKGLTLSLYETNAGTAIRVFDNSTAPVVCENSHIEITGYQNSTIAPAGSFIDCRATVRNVKGNSFCYSTAQQGLLRVERGEYRAYTADASAVSAVCGQVSAPGGSVLHAVNCPAIVEAGYIQTNALYILGGVASVSDLITTLPIVATGADVRGTLALNRPNL